MVTRTVLAAILSISVQLLPAQRTVLDFNGDWKFQKGNDNLAFQPGHDDAKWRRLDLPHDWSIESDFLKEAPATNQGGSLPGGTGWYRKTFTLPASAAGKKVTIAFDGVYKNSEVWINGHYLGKRPNGYVPFSYDLTDFLLPFPQQNIIAVKVDNSLQPDSRWYSGSGIYRTVKLVITGKLHLDEKSLFVTNPIVETDSVFLNVKAKLDSGVLVPKGLKYRISVLGADNRPVSSVLSDFSTEPGEINNTLVIRNPEIWSVSNPYLYKIKLDLLGPDGNLLDNLSLNFGFRTFMFDPANGFFLNYKPLKIKGVCLHHDLGILGAAFDKSAARRQLLLLKDMGCNAIRISHNPPAAELLDLCDEMGFLVMDEAFDMWRKRKNKFDYHLDFEEWSIRDLEAMVLRDRNHPSVFMWSIGNEIREQFDSTGTVIAKRLVSAIKSLDPTRPVTSAMTETRAEKNFISASGALDVLGFNYKDYDYAALPSRFPGKKFIATETASALETRGVYQYPSEIIRVWPADYKEQDTFARGNPDYTCAAYDNTHAYWGNTHEKSWLAVKRSPFMAGLFVWSGFDYLGEPLPYPAFPARSSYYGIIDLAGFPKDVYYMYQSEWTDKPVLHLFPHWNWRQGDTVDVWAYYNNADEVELYLNGRSLGIRRKTDTVLHVSWSVPFEPGTLKAVSRKKGEMVLMKEITTAGQVSGIKMEYNTTRDTKDSSSLSFITVTLTDKQANTVPDSDRIIRFKLKGPGSILGTDNGYQADTNSLQAAERITWKGLALVLVKSSRKKGRLKITAKSPGLRKSVYRWSPLLASEKAGMY